MATTWWYYDSNGQKRGPVSGGELKGLSKTGRITPETIVENEKGKSAPAGKVRGLTFATSESAQPVEKEIYGLATPPPEPSPFTASVPRAMSSSVVIPSEAANPFTAPAPVVAKPLDNPFTAFMPTASQAIPQDVPVSDWAIRAGYAAVLSLIIACVVMLCGLLGL